MLLISSFVLSFIIVFLVLAPIRKQSIDRSKEKFVMDIIRVLDHVKEGNVTIDIDADPTDFPSRLDVKPVFDTGYLTFIFPFRYYRVKNVKISSADTIPRLLTLKEFVRLLIAMNQVKKDFELLVE